MGNYEALQKAEKERKQKASGGEPVEVGALQWDSTPKTAPTADRPGFFERVMKRKKKPEEPVLDANEVNKRRVSILRPESYITEQFRTLRGRIEALAAQREIKTIGMTSANPGEGKSTASINLAVVSSMSVGKKVIIVDCDLRRPTIHLSLGISPEVGLCDVLAGSASLDDAIVKVEGTNLDALPVRSLPENPSELLASQEMVGLIEELRRRYDRIVLDTPATLGLPDSKIVSDLCDGIVVVVRAGATPRAEVGAVLEILDRNKVIGMVLNDADVDRESYGYY